jgi:anti-anti-sigma regulatory factor
VVVALTALDSSSVSAFRRRLNGVLFAGYHVIVVDLASAGSLDNQTLAELCVELRRARHARRDGASLRIVGADRRARWVLELCGIDGLAFAGRLRERARAYPRPAR